MRIGGYAFNPPDEGENTKTIEETGGAGVKSKEFTHSWRMLDWTLSFQEKNHLILVSLRCFLSISFLPFPSLFFPSFRLAFGHGDLQMWNWCKERIFLINTHFSWSRSSLFSTCGIIQFTSFIRYFLQTCWECFSIVFVRERKVWSWLKFLGLARSRVRWVRWVSGWVRHLTGLPGPEGTGAVSDLIFRNGSSEETSSVYSYRQ